MNAFSYVHVYLLVVSVRCIRTHTEALLDVVLGLMMNRFRVISRQYFCSYVSGRRVLRRLSVCPPCCHVNGSVVPPAAPVLCIHN